MRALRIVAGVLGILVIVLFVAVIGVLPGAFGGSGQDDDMVTTLGFVPYWDQDRAFEEVDRYADELSAVGPWWYAPTPDGAIVPQHAEYTDIDLERVRELQGRGQRVMPAIANHRDGSWDFDLIGELLSDPDAVTAHVEALTDLVVDHDYDGIQLDYENLDADDARRYADLVRRVAEAFAEHDKTLAVAVHAKLGPETDGWGAGHDYALLGRYADEIHLMAYDLHYNTSDPGPPAPAWWVDEVLDYATTEVPAEKVVLGIGLYGYDWPEGARGEGLTLQEAEARVRRYDGELTFDTRSQSPRFTYERDGQTHELWFEDGPSIARKLEFVETYGLGGAFFWRMGGTTPEAWDAVGEALELG